MSLLYVLARVVKDVFIVTHEPKPVAIKHPTTYIIFFTMRLCEAHSYSLLLFHHHVNERLCPHYS